MTCREMLDQIEAIAARDVEVGADARAHLETCPRCAGALAAARRLEALLAARPGPSAPPRFSQAVVQAVRRERWRTEQHVDWFFNASIAIGLAVVVFGVAALVNLQGLFSLGGAGWSVAARISGDIVRQAAPMLATYVAAAGLLVSTLVLWWWAERRFSM